VFLIFADFLSANLLINIGSLFSTSVLKESQKFILPNLGRFLRGHLASRVKVHIFIYLGTGEGNPWQG